MEIPSSELILSTLDRFTGGCFIHIVDGVVELGYSSEFVSPLAETYCDNPDKPQETLRDAASERRLERMHGVHDLDMLMALAKLVKADTSIARAYGTKRRCRQYAEAIRRTLGQPPTPIEPV